MSGEEQKQRKSILLFSLLEADSWVTSSQLARQLDLSDRTVRTMMAELADTLASQGVALLAERGKGYSLPDMEKPRVRSLLAAGRLVGNAFRGDLLLELLQLREPEDADILSERLFVSRTTLENELKQVKRELWESGGQLTLVRKKNTIAIEGSELNKRNLIGSHIANSFHAQMSADLVSYTPYFPYDELIFVMNTVYDAVHHHSVPVSDAGIIAVTIHAIIAVKRILQGFCLPAWPATEEDAVVDGPELLVAQEIASVLEPHFSISMNAGEWDAIAHAVFFRRFFRAQGIDQQEMTRVVDPAYPAFIRECLKEIRELYFLDLTRDADLLAGLACHLQAAVERNEYKIRYVNPILEDMRSKYPFVFELAIFFRNKFARHLGINLSESETACLAIHLGASVERLKSVNQPQKLKLALVCHASPSNSRFLMAKILSIFGAKIHLCGPYSVFDAQTILREKPSLIVSTTTAAMEWSRGIPVACIKLIPDEEDARRLGRMIDSVGKRLLGTHRFTDFFHPDFFFPALGAQHSSQVISLMADRLFAAGRVLGGFKESTFQRETFSTTVLQNGIALPHPTEFYAVETTIAIATLEHPIEWNGSRAQIIFMLAIKKGDQKFLEDFYELVVNLSDHGEYVAQMAEIRSFPEIIRFMQDLG